MPHFWTSKELLKVSRRGKIVRSVTLLGEVVIPLLQVLNRGDVVKDHSHLEGKQESHSRKESHRQHHSKDHLHNPREVLG